MERSHKIRIYPNKAQTKALYATAGTTRYVYNWGLERWLTQYEEYKNGTREKAPTAYSLSREWTASRPEWSRDTARCPQTTALLNLGKAWHNFFNFKHGKPSFKKRRSTDSFYMNNADSYIKNGRLLLSKIGWVKLSEKLRFEGDILGFTIIREADKWFVSITVRLLNEIKPEGINSQSIVGVDVGCNNIAYASDGSFVENPKLIKKSQRRIRRFQRKLSRSQKNSKNRQKVRIKLQKIYSKIKNVRKDAIHKFTTQLSKNHGTAVVETLNIVGMQQNSIKTIRDAVFDTCMAVVQSQLSYKMHTIKAPKYFPSSKTCSHCNTINYALQPTSALFVCPSCGFKAHRDFNASLNLKNFAVGYTVKACGVS